MYPNPNALAGGHNAGHFEPGMPLISPSKKKRRQRKSGRQGGVGEGLEPEQQQQQQQQQLQKQQKPIPKALNRAPLDASHPLDALLDRLQARSVYPLRNRSMQCPKALYFCRLCSYHCDNIDRAEQHIKGNRHIMKENNRDMREFLLFIPTPLPSHLHRLSTACLSAEASACALPEAELNRRLAVFEEVKQFLEKVPGLSPDLRLQAFGSTMSGFAMHDSDVNIDVVDARDRRQLLGRFLLQSYQAMQEFNNAKKRFVVLEDNFMGAYPYFLAKDAENVEYKFSVNNSHCMETNALLKIYCDMDERCKQLGYLFRKLAKLSHMDKQDVGTFPPLAFPLMAIHFLQQIHPPVLPVLHHLAKDNAAIPHSALTKITVDDTELVYVHEPAKYWTSKNDESVGELWLKMLRYYAVDFNYESQVISITSPTIVKKAAKGWKHKRVSIEDPMFPKRDLGRSLGLNDVMDYVLLQLRTAYRYFAVPQTEEGPLFRYVKRLAVDATDSGTPGTAKRRVHITPLFNPNGELWRTATKLVEELRTAGYMHLVNQPDLVEPHPCGLRATVLAVGNRILNILGINNTAAIDLMLPEYPTPPALTDEIVDEECKKAVREFLELIVNTYFRVGNWDMKVKTLRRRLRAALVQCLDRCRQACEVDSPKVDDSIEGVARNLVQQIINEAMDSLTAEKQGSGSGKGVSESSSEPTNGKVDTAGSAEQNEGSALSEDDDSDEDEKASGENEPINGLPNLPLGVVSCDEPGYLSFALYRNLSPEKLHYNFSCTGMVGDMKPPELRCSSCNRCGHLRDSCPEDEVDFRTVKLPNVSAADSHLMTTLLQQVPNDFLETDEHRQARNRLLTDISQTLKKTPYQQGELEMFGSCVNGFGFHTSDVDVCMSFYDSLDNPKEFSDKEVRDIVVDIAKIMKRCKKFYPCRAIPQAKVPIVKFTHWPTKQEGDLSLNNRLALQNSKLLLTYHNMDSRVKTLGFIIKILAKLCGIGDASRGSLSSYAYIILMLHYLQQENVIPCLQEMYPRDKPKPVLTIEGWDAWFNDDMQYVYEHWKSRNNKTVSELWLGFLTYYTQVFNWRQTVVTIKQTKPLHRLEKLWTQAHLAIEDPFDLNHNLGCGLSKKMATYIQRVLFKTLLHFRNPLPNLPPAQIKDFLFDPKKLTGPLGPVPRDRCCKTCGVIGHIARECPTTTRGRNAEGEFPGEMEGAEGEEAEEELEEEEEEFGEEGEEISEESPTTPGKANTECQPAADVPDGEAMPGPEARQRGNSQSSSAGPSTPSGAVRSRASPQKPPPPTTTVQAQLMYPTAGSVVGPPPPPIVYVPNSPGNSSSPYQLSMRPIMMTVDNRDVAVPVATAPSADILMNMFCNVWNTGPGPYFMQPVGPWPVDPWSLGDQAGTGLPRLELDPNQQDPCILGVGPVASGPGAPNAMPVTQTNPNAWPRLPQAAGQSMTGSRHHHPPSAMPFQVQQPQQTGSHTLSGPSHNTFQQQRQANQDHHQQQHRGGFHGGGPPVGNRSQRSPHPQLPQQAQGQGQQPPYSRALARDFGSYPGQLDSPSHSHMHPGHQNSNMYHRPPPGAMLGQHGNQFGVHHRHGYQQQQYQHHHQQQPMPLSVPPVQQRRPAALQQPHQQQFGHPNGPTTSSAPFKGGPKRRG